MSVEILPVTLKNLRNFVNRKIQELDPRYSESHISCLKREYQSLLERFEKREKLTNSSLGSFINDQIDSLIEEQKAERSQKRLGKGPEQLYSRLRRLYNDVRYEFGLKRIRNI